MKRSLDRLHRPFFCLFVKKAKKWSSNNPIISATLFEAVKSHKLLVMNTVLFAVANSRPNGGFRDFYSPSVKIPPQIERTRAVRPSQIPFSGEFSTPESEFVTENGGCTAQNGHGLYDCRKTERRRQSRASLRKPMQKSAGRWAFSLTANPQAQHHAVALLRIMHF